MVSVVRCESYDAGVCREALGRVLAPLGGLDFAAPGVTVGIKANLVAAMRPGAAATTHPSLLAALTRLLRERGARVIIGDSPGGLYNAASLRNIYRVTGMREAEEAGAELNWNFARREAVFPEAAAARSFTYTAWLDECDVLINFCKLKSHGMMGMSAAAKNMFGAIPGTMKPEYHYKYPDLRQFSRMLVDLDTWFAPALSLVDGVVGMEGNGPTAGRPRPMGVLLASDSPHEVDMVCAHILGLDRREIPTLQEAIGRGLIPAEMEALELVGDPDEFVLRDFDGIRTKNDLLFRSVLPGRAGEFCGNALRRILGARPAPERSACVGCGKCAGLCPAGAIEMRDGLPRIRRGKCIRCFCCQEFCPCGAMKARRTALARLLVK